MNIKPQAKSEHDGRDVMRRAAVAYLSDPKARRWPDEAESGIEHDARKLLYAVLRDRYAKVLAVFRVRSEGKLIRVEAPEGLV
jgi:hypothetical protein